MVGTVGAVAIALLLLLHVVGHVGVLALVSRWRSISWYTKRTTGPRIVVGRLAEVLWEGDIVWHGGFWMLLEGGETMRN